MQLDTSDALIDDSKKFTHISCTERFDGVVPY